MYSSYHYLENISKENFLSDIVSICIGETNVNNLSSGCNKELTTINTSSTLAGWSLYDSTAYTNETYSPAMCLRSPLNDNATKYKYSLLSTRDYLTYGLRHYLYDNWNNLTHTGSNPANGTNFQPVFSKNGRLEISCSNRHMIFFNIGNGPSGCFTGIFERTRLSPWDTIENDYLPVCFYNAYNEMYEIKIKKNGANDDTTARGYLTHKYFSSSSTTTGFGVLSSYSSNPLILKHYMIPFGTTSADIGFFGGEISLLCDVYLTTGGTAFSNLDTVYYNNNEYVIWKDVLGGYNFMVRKG